MEWTPENWSFWCDEGLNQRIRLDCISKCAVSDGLATCQNSDTKRNVKIALYTSAFFSFSLSTILSLSFAGSLHLSLSLLSSYRNVNLISSLPRIDLTKSKWYDSKITTPTTTTESHVSDSITMLSRHTKRTPNRNAYIKHSKMQANMLKHSKITLNAFRMAMARIRCKVKHFFLSCVDKTPCKTIDTDTLAHKHRVIFVCRNVSLHTQTHSRKMF